MAELVHLARRFAGSISPRPPRRDDENWARSQLLSAEVSTWAAMPRADRRHAIGVARRVQEALPGAERPVLAAALLHDCGKADARLGTYGRVVATICAAIAGRDAAEMWAQSRGITRRIGLYLLHPTIGGDTLAMAGSDPLTVAWAREHHLPEDRWTIDPAIARVLKAADDD